MRVWKKLLTLICGSVLLFGLSVCSVSAAEQPYTYRVTIYAGNQGKFGGTEGLVLSNKDAQVTQTEDKIVVSGLQYGDEVAYTAQADVKLDNSSKYYVKGIRLGGRDNDTVAASAFIVKSDMDYVVAYGIKGNQVSYTVNYHDEYGNEMLKSETFYGNVGDKPVIACKYVNGYMPQASGLTKTLKENAAENVMTFIYKPNAGPTVETIITTVVKEEYVDGVQIVPGSTGGAGTGTGNAGGEAGTGEGGTGTVEVGGQTGGETGGQTSDEGENGTEDSFGEGTGEGEGDDIIIDLDEEDVPLANQDPVIDETSSKDVPMFSYVGLIIAALAALAALAGVACALRRRGNNEDNEEA